MEWVETELQVKLPAEHESMTLYYMSQYYIFLRLV